jgi:hypothetical protein
VAFGWVMKFGIGRSALKKKLKNPSKSTLAKWAGKDITPFDSL